MFRRERALMKGSMTPNLHNGSSFNTAKQQEKWWERRQEENPMACGSWRCWPPGLTCISWAPSLEALTPISWSPLHTSTTSFLLTGYYVLYSPINHQFPNSDQWVNPTLQDFKTKFLLNFVLLNAHRQEFLEHNHQSFKLLKDFVC
jgi:hypothetical protein